MKFLTDFTYRNLHGFARFPDDSTALVCPGNMQEILARRTQQTTGLMVGYEVIKVLGKQVVEWRGPCRLR